MAFVTCCVRVIDAAKRNDPDYRASFHCFRSPSIVRLQQLLDAAQTFQPINRRRRTSFEIPFHPLDEQTAIAEVLSDMDAEIAALEQRRAKTRALKQGMMQELLTGKTRLV